MWRSVFIAVLLVFSCSTFAPNARSQRAAFPKVTIDKPHKLPAEVVFLLKKSKLGHMLKGTSRIRWFYQGMVQNLTVYTGQPNYNLLVGRRGGDRNALKAKETKVLPWASEVKLQLCDYRDFAGSHWLPHIVDLTKDNISIRIHHFSDNMLRPAVYRPSLRCHKVLLKGLKGNTTYKIFLGKTLKGKLFLAKKIQKKPIPKPAKITFTAPGQHPICSKPFRAVECGKYREIKGCLEHEAKRLAIWKKFCTNKVPASRPVVNCKKRPAIVCCAALTESCRRCSRRAAKLERLWKAKCKKPVVPKFNCKAPPSVNCCQAMTRGCMMCKLRARVLYQRWAAKCRPSFRIIKPTIDCHRRPPLVCCKAMTPGCLRCARIASAWQKKCAHKLKPRKPLLPPHVRAAFCKRKPSIMCCQAMIPSCLSCKRRAREILAKWHAMCMPKFHHPRP